MPSTKDNKAEEFGNHYFRALNYLGSKLRILDFIEGAVDSISLPQDGVCDLFAGAGSVTYRLSRTRKVYSSDIQEYSRVICSALTRKINRASFGIDAYFDSIQHLRKSSVLNAFKPLMDSEKEALRTGDINTMAHIIEDGSLEVYRLEKRPNPISKELDAVLVNLTKGKDNPFETKISRYYGGIYFSYEQAIQIDLILNSIANIDIQYKDICLAALLSTVSDIVNTVGKQFAQPLKMRDSQGNLKAGSMRKIQKDRTIEVFGLYKEWLERYFSISPGKDTNVVRQDYLQSLLSLPEDIRVVYADPPYTRDHYSRYYHVLETIALQDMPTLSTTTIRGTRHISRGIYRDERHQSPFCIRSQAPIEFDRMCRVVAETGRKLLLSYSPYDETKKTHPRVVTIHQLEEIAGRYFQSVETVSAGHFQHSKLTSVEHQLEASDMAELLIICQ